ncbi:MAG: hypothetical protein KDE27_01415 [Planctomycetes bacterium]|nr:hypothetical protein [Planctomycetota bacterium]
MHLPVRAARPSRLALLAGVTAGLAPAQSWVAVTDSVDISDVPCAYDSYRGRVVAVDSSNGRAFEHDGARWLAIGALPTVFGKPVSVAYQEHSGRTLALVAGAGSVFSTFEYDGHSFTQLSPVHVPPARQYTQLTYDSVRDVVVLFGGGDASPAVSYQDTWEWNGVDWLQRQPATSPPPRQNAAMAYDPGRGVTVLFGGVDGGTTLGDHWEWNGVNWAQPSLGSLPTARRRAQLAYDAGRNRMVLYGGVGPQNGLPFFDPQPWEFDGQQWSQQTIANPPEGRSHHAMVAVPGGVRVFGGVLNPFQPATFQPLDILDYDGLSFQRRAGSGTNDVFMALDSARGRTVVLTRELPGTRPPRTFEWDGFALDEVLVAGPNVDTNGFALTAGLGGPGSGVVGFASNGTTWDFDGTQWSQLPATGPSPRSYAALATDTTRGVVVLFGGVDSVGELDDTWEWNGASWTNVPAAGPSRRASASAAFEPTTGRVVLYGGVSGLSYLPETWAYTGAGWTRIDNGNLPAEFGQVAWSSERQRLMLARTTNGGFGPPATLELVGNAWLPLLPADPEREIYRLATDPNGHVIACGGADPLDVALLTGTPATLALAGSGCSTRPVAPRLALHDRGRPGSVLRGELIGAEPNGIALFAGSHAFATTAVGPCLLHLQQPAVLAVAATNAVGQATLPIAVPAVAALVGVPLGLQAVSAEAGGPIGGALALSDAIRIVIGD